MSLLILQVVLGGGRREFLPNNISDPEYPTLMGLRKDGRNLVNEWQSAHPREAAYVWNKEDFDDVDPDTTEYVFGNHINIYFIFITSN